VEDTVMAKVKLNVPNVLGSNNNVEDTNMSNNEVTIDDLVSNEVELDAPTSNNNTKVEDTKVEDTKVNTPDLQKWFRTQLSSGKAPCDYTTGKLVGKAIKARPDMEEALLTAMSRWWDTPMDAKEVRNSAYNALVDLIRDAGIDVPAPGNRPARMPLSKTDKAANIANGIAQGITSVLSGIVGGVTSAAVSGIAKGVTQSVVDTEKAISDVKMNHMRTVVDNFTNPISMDIILKYQQIQLLKAQAKAAAKAASKSAAKSVDSTEKS